MSLAGDANRHAAISYDAIAINSRIGVLSQW